MSIDRRTFCKAAIAVPALLAAQAQASLMVVSGNRSGPAADLPGAVWISQDEIDSLPTSGTFWTALSNRAASSFTGPAGGNDDIADTNTLATALVAATGDGTALTKCQGLLDDAVTGAIAGDTSLSACRNLTCYAIAADIIGYADSAFVAWVKAVVARDFETWGAGQDGNSTGEGSIFWKIWKVNNHGSMALAAFAALSRYLQRIEPEVQQWTDNLDHVYQCLRYYTGEDPSIVPSAIGYTGKSAWNYGPDSENWQQLVDSNFYVIYPRGATYLGDSIDGLLAEEARRGGGTYEFPPPDVTYYWESMQGLTVAMHIMDRAGYSVLHLGDYAHRRAAQFLYRGDIDYPIVGDDLFQAPLLDFMYGPNAIQAGGLWDGTTTVDQGKNMGWTDWTHGLRVNYA